MDFFSISQLSQLSGVKPHTIRVWEQRYKALNPNRSEGNTRFYDSSQLRRLLNIVSLMDGGYKISELGPLSDQELLGRVEKFYSVEDPQGPEGYYISQLLSAGMNFDEGLFEKIFSHCLLRFGMVKTYTQVLYPLMTRMGLMWSYDAFLPAYEHFNSNLLRQKLCTALDSLPPAPEAEGGWLLFLPENEFHELGLLFAQYLIRVSGRRSLYLGANVPIDSVFPAIKQARPDTLLLFMVRNESPDRAQQYLDDLASDFNDLTVFVSGRIALLEQLQLKPPLHWLREVKNLEQVLHQNV